MYVLPNNKRFCLKVPLGWARRLPAGSSNKWGKGEILQDHSLLLLLSLRDNNLKEAKILSDLFYHRNPELQQAVVQEVTSNQGKGVAI